MVFDERKSAINFQKHGVTLAESEMFDLANALVVEDDREQYDETRYNALGFYSGNLYHLTFTIVQGTIRAISFRKATSSERTLYAEHA